MAAMEARQYTPGDVYMDAELLAWWLHLGETGDLEACFGRPATALTEFIRMIGTSTIWYLRDEQGWAAAVWADRLLSGVALGLWVRADKRSSPRVLPFVRATLEGLLDQYKVLVFATRHEALMDQATRAFGFVGLGTIPYLFDGDDCSIAYATQFTYEAALNGAQHEESH